MEYKRLGDYIRLVDVRNRDLKVTNLLGVSISKEFMPSIANTIGTDMSVYKIVERGQFAYGPVTSRNGDKVSIALLNDYDNAIISQAYTVFEVIDHNALSPEYLMMWFKRPEFDRYARFHSHGSAREIFDWNELCDVLLPIPSIEEQRRIMSEYQTVEQRIQNNEQLIKKLEETAQAIYNHTFVEGIDEENLPKGWRKEKLGEVASVLDFMRKPLSGEEREKIKGVYPYYGAMSIVDYINDYIFDGTYLLFSEDGANVVDENGFPALQYIWGKFWLNNHAHILQGKDFVSTEYLYCSLKNKYVGDLVTGAAQPKINQENMCGITMIIGDKAKMEQFNNQVKHIFDYIKNLSEENSHLNSLLSLLTSKLS